MTGLIFTETKCYQHSLLTTDEGERLIVGVDDMHEAIEFLRDADIPVDYDWDYDGDIVDQYVAG